MFARLVAMLVLVALSATTLEAQRSSRRSAAACRCEPSGKPRKPRFLLPVAGGLGFFPASVAARDSQLPTLAMPSLIDIRDDTPRSALEGERALAVGALAPDTATPLPTVMLLAATLVLGGGYLVMPRRRRRASAWHSRPARAFHGVWRLRSVHRRRLGAIVAASGGLLLVLGSREYAEGAQAQRRARAEWLREGDPAARNAESDAGLVSVPTRVAQVDSAPLRAPESPARATAPSAVPLPVLAFSGRELRRGSAVARLQIESIEMDEIVLEGVGPLELNGGPGHYPGSVLPGGSGNSIVSAHRDRHFRRVGELSIGSRIRTETREGVVEWVVTDRRIVSKDTPSLFEESEPTLTLTTCWPLRYFGPAPDRLLIVAKRAA